MRERAETSQSYKSRWQWEVEKVRRRDETTEGCGIDPYRVYEHMPDILKFL